jgi:hypothetical protein
VQVNHRYVGAQTPESFDRLVADLRSGARDADIPPHGTLIRVRRSNGLAVEHGVVAEERAAAAEERAAREAAASDPGGGA